MVARNFALHNTSSDLDLVARRKSSSSCLARSVRSITGGKAIFTPARVPLDLHFFRRVFTALHQRCGTENGEVPVTAFQRAVVRLFRVLGMQEDFDASEYDIDNSGAVGWFEFVACWQRSRMTLSLSVYERIFFAMEEPDFCIAGRLISALLTTLISMSCLCFILGTLPDFKHSLCETCEPQQWELLETLEGVCVGAFTIEYAVRVATAPFSRSELLDLDAILASVGKVGKAREIRTVSPLWRFYNFVTQPMNVIDLAIILPYYFEIIFHTQVNNLTVLRVLRLTRLIRLVKLGKTLEAMAMIIRVISRASRIFSVLAVYLVLGLCFSSAAMYYAEGGDWDPELKAYYIIVDGERQLTQFHSIPHSMWWCLVTFTTVGYGEITPVTPLGKCVASATMVVGILVLAMPVSVINTSFSEVWQEWNAEKLQEALCGEADRQSVNHALQCLLNRRRLLVELYDHQMTSTAPQFLGQAEWKDLPLHLDEAASQERTLPLEANDDQDISTEIVSGSVRVQIHWTPDGDHTEAIRGTLQVRLCGAKGLSLSDWNSAGMRLVYAVVSCWPAPPQLGSGDSTVAPLPGETRQTQRVKSLHPEWNWTGEFKYDWPDHWDPFNERLRRKKKGRNCNRQDCLRPSGKDCDGKQVDFLVEDITTSEQDEVVSQRAHRSLPSSVLQLIEKQNKQIEMLIFTLEKSAVGGSSPVSQRQVSGVAKNAVPNASAHQDVDEEGLLQSMRSLPNQSMAFSAWDNQDHDV